MRLIQKYLPNPRHTEVYRIFVKADPGSAWNTVRHLDMGQVPLVRLLFDIRTLPDKLKGKLKEEDRRIGVDQITDKGKGFFIAEVIIPLIAVGQFLIAIGMLLKDWFVKWACIGSIIFLLSIAPLMVGAAFPFSITVSIAALRILLNDDRNYIWKKQQRLSIA